MTYDDPMSMENGPTRMTYDDHAICRKEIEYWRHKLEDPSRVRDVVQEIENGFKVLKVIRVDAFKDGLRVVVR
jgi:hypothetical protein